MARSTLDDNLSLPLIYRPAPIEVPVLDNTDICPATADSRTGGGICTGFINSLFLIAE